MKWTVRLLLLAALVALGWWVWTMMFPNPRKVVWQRLEKLAEISSFPTNEGQLTKLASIQKFGAFFSDDVTVNLKATGEETHTFANRDDLVQAMQAARMSLNSVAAKFHDPNIEITPGKQEAIVGVSLTVDVNGEKNTIVADLKIEMKKIDGDWLITHVETVE